MNQDRTPQGEGSQAQLLVRRDAIADWVDAHVGPVGVVVVRWLLGLMWLSNVNWKVPTEFGGLRNFVQAGVDHPVAPGSAWLFDDVVLPQMELFGWLTLLVEVGVAAALLSGRAVRTAGVVSALQVVPIGLAVANAPGEWYWAYLLMLGLSIAVIVSAPRDRPHSPRTMGVVGVVYGLIVAATNIESGFLGDDNATRTLFTGGNDIPDEFGVAMFVGSIALGAAFVIAGSVVFLLADRSTNVRTAVGWVMVAVATVLLFTYRGDPDTLLVGLGSRAVHCGALAVLGLSLLPRSPRSDPAAVPTATSEVTTS